MLARSRSRTLVVFAALIGAPLAPSLAGAQAFQNLDFENVVLGLIGNPPEQLEIVVDVPGWTFSHADPPQRFPHLGSSPQQFLVNDYAGPGWPGGSAEVLQGHYAVAMAAGRVGPNFDILEGPWIEQAGVVPTGSQSVRLRATSPFTFLFPQPDSTTFTGPRAWHLSLNGLDIPMILLANGDWSGDVTSFADALANLRIEINENYPFQPYGGSPDGVNMVADSIRFSPLPYNVAPEPSIAVLVALQISFLMACRRRSQATSS